MYCPPAFREDRLPILYDAVRAHPLGTLITHGAAGLLVNVLPFTLRINPSGGMLRAHLAKANDQVLSLREGASTVVIFQGPQAYVSPSWYATKPQHGKVVPTWNYVVIQARGTPTIIDDRNWLRDQIDELTSIHEDGRPEPWSTLDAPAEFIDGQMNGIVGLEISIESIEGKWKTSQNQPISNRIGVERGLREDGCTNMADEILKHTDKEAGQLRKNEA